jgi:hypothetical protein
MPFAGSIRSCRSGDREAVVAAVSDARREQSSPGLAKKRIPVGFLSGTYRLRRIAASGPRGDIVLVG